MATSARHPARAAVLAGADGAPPATALAGGAEALRHAAAAMGADGGSRPEVSGLSTTLAYVEEALDRMQTALGALAASPAIDDDAREEAEALHWHLTETAVRLRRAGDTCGAARRWSGAVAATSPAPRRETSPATRAVPPDAVALCEVADADGRHLLSAVIDQVTLTYSILAVDPGGRTTELRRHVATLREARDWALQRAGRS